MEVGQRPVYVLAGGLKSLIDAEQLLSLLLPPPVFFLKRKKKEKKERKKEKNGRKKARERIQPAGIITFSNSVFPNFPVRFQ